MESDLIALGREQHRPLGLAEKCGVEKPGQACTCCNQAE
ncbi:hypothetical protein FBY03_106114 [Pseudomonas sp. SJZ079]|nr:hypothetical protein FBY03_106114 [Pseudomonas sp. SJZ079]